jgi:hypothetical protein
LTCGWNVTDVPWGSATPSHVYRECHGNFSGALILDSEATEYTA